MSANTTKETLNNTEELVTSDYIKGLWIFSQIANGFIFLTTIWILVSFIRYIQKSKSSNRKRRKRFIALWFIFCFVILILRLIMTQILLILNEFSNSDSFGYVNCEKIMDLSLILFPVAILPTYIFLWYRQLMLYKQPSLQQLKGTKVKFFSHSVIAILFTLGTVSTLTSTIPTNYQMSNIGCIKRLDQNPNFLPNYLNALTLVLSQTILLGLFCYPLFMHYKTNKSIRSLYVRTQRREFVDFTNKVIKSAIISMVVCISSDIFAVILSTAVLDRKTPVYVSRTIYNFSLLINMISVMFSFIKVKQFMFTYCFTSNEKTADCRESTVFDI